MCKTVCVNYDVTCHDGIIQSEVLTKCDSGDYDFHDFVANNVFFHDRLIERWMCEIDADVVFHEFSTKASLGDSLESKKF